MVSFKTSVSLLETKLEPNKMFVLVVSLLYIKSEFQYFDLTKTNWNKPNQKQIKK